MERHNPKMDFSSSVDTSQLFNFVDELMNIDNLWVHEFEFANDISERLKYQFAYLFYDSLTIRKKIKSNNLSKKVLQTRPNKCTGTTAWLGVSFLFSIAI